MSERLSLGVDIGGTKTAVGLVNETGAVVERLVVPTPKDSAESLVAAIANAVRDLEQRQDALEAGIGVAVAALVDRTRGMVPFAAHLPLEQVPFQVLIEQATGRPVSVDNDATAAMSGEWAFGAAKGSTECLMVSVGTGIGGGAVCGGLLQRGAHGMAGEIGHQRFIPEGRLCACGLKGCWEQYGSGRVLDRWAREHLDGGTSIAGLLISKAGSVERVTGKTVSQLAADGVAEARECLAEVGFNIGVGMASLAAVFDPELFVVGGGLADNGNLLLEPMAQAFEQHFFGAAHRDTPPIALALLGPDAALIGAAGLAPR